MTMVRKILNITSKFHIEEDKVLDVCSRVLGKVQAVNRTFFIMGDKIYKRIYPIEFEIRTIKAKKELEKLKIRHPEDSDSTPMGDDDLVELDSSLNNPSNICGPANVYAPYSSGMQTGRQRQGLFSRAE